MHKILILTASIGSGHIKRRLLPDAEITTVDFMARRISRIHWFMKEFYLAMLAFVPNLYDVFYKLSGGSSGGTLVQNAFAWIMMPPESRPSAGSQKFSESMAILKLPRCNPNTKTGMRI